MLTMGMIRGIVVSCGLLMAFSQVAGAEPPAGGGQASPAMKQRSERTPEDMISGRLQSMAKQYNLSEEQQAKLKPILEEEILKLKELQNKESLARKEIRKDAQEKLKAILTPEQLKKMEESRLKAESLRKKNKSTQSAPSVKE
jgi:Spy/CpxP family protein refolding chaperone